MLWGLRWAFEGRVVSGQLSPDVAMDAMERFVALLFGMGALVAAALAALLVHLAHLTRAVKQWPPSGSWPVPRPISDADAVRLARRLHVGAALAGIVAIAALARAFT
jgi:hypothetical protein